MPILNLIQNNIDILVRQQAHAIKSPIQYECKAGILFLDVCSYTKITEKFSKTGHYGVELITGMLNRYFDMLDEIITETGGYLIKYGGDAILAIYPQQDNISIPSMLYLRKELPHRLSLLNRELLRDYHEDFRFHGGCGYGVCHLNVVGKEKYHLDYFVTGDAVVQAYKMTDSAGENEITIPDEFENYNPDIPLAHPSSSSEQQTGDVFVPTEIREKLTKGDFRAELRQTAVLFLKIRAHQSSLIPLELYQKVYAIIQDTVYQLHGIINKIDYNDKGYLILITFGTITINPDDIERAFICAYRIRNRLSNLVDVKIGLTRDSIYSGIIGSRSHYEFGIIGNSVNVAARLLSGIDYGGIAFTEEILEKIKDKFETEFVLETTAKGIAKPIRIYSLIREISVYRKLYDSCFKDLFPIAYQDTIKDVKHAITQQTGKIFCFRGESGTGKSFIAYTILKSLDVPDEQICLLVAEEFNRDFHLESIRKLLQSFFATDDIVRDFSLVSQYCTSRNLPFEEDDFKEYLSAGLQQEFLFEDERITKNRFLNQNLILLCCSLLKNVKFLIIDDSQWCDRVSMEILLKVVSILSDQRTVSVIISHQSGLIAVPGAEIVDFNNLLPDKSSELIKTILKNVTPDAQGFIHSLSGGNPLYIIEICRTLSKYVTGDFDLITGQQVKQFMLSGSVSDTMASIFMSEYDNLSFENQQFLKFASIIGKAFSLDEINQITDVNSSGEIRKTIDNLQSEGVISKVDLNPTMLFIFSNKLMRETIYSSILRSEKLHLHEKLGQYYETILKRDNTFNYELVAIHYILAENSAKAIEYSSLAGEKNLRVTNLGVALHYYETALKLSLDEADKIAYTLTVIDILLRMSETGKAENLLSSLTPSRITLPDDELKFRYLKTRLRLIRCEYEEIISESVIPNLNEIYSIRIALYQLDAYRFLGRFEQFDQLASNLMTLFNEAERKDYLGEILAILGQTMINRGKYALAEQYYTEKLDIAREREDYYAMRIAYSSLGIIQSRQGNKVKAREYYQHALNAADKSGDKNGYAKVMMDLGTISKNENNLKEAEVFYQKSMAIAKSIGNRQQVSLVLYNLGEMLLWQDQYERALDYFLQSRQIAELLNDVVSLSYCDDAIGDCYFRLEKFEQAERTYKLNEELQLRINDREGLAHTWGNLGNIAKTKEDFSGAIEYYHKQQVLLKEVGDLDGEGRALFNWAMIHILKNEKVDALAKLNQAHELFLKCGAVQLADFTLEQINKYKE